MACYHPITAFRVFDDTKLVFEAFKGYRPENLKEELTLKCGRCIGCRLDYSLAWAGRISSEAKLYERNAFITLTYADEHLPEHGQLLVEDFQKFMRDLRYRYSGHQPVPFVDDDKKYNSIRYYMGAEYGEHNSRPHFHVCLLNFQFHDLKRLFVNQSGDQVYTSKQLTKLWGKGHCSTADLTLESAAYVSRYVTKKINGDAAKDHYERLDPETGEIYQLNKEFATMSRRPGIGIPFLLKYQDDVYQNDQLMVRKKDKSYLTMKPPRTFDNYLEKINPDLFDQLKETRAMDQLRRELENPEEYTEARLLVKEEVKLYQAKQLKRGFNEKAFTKRT
jgi:hypothetical protein